MKKQIIRIIGLIILTVIIHVKDLKSQTHSEYIRFQRLSLEQGLSQSTVNDILLDQRGFLWIATQDGLNQYDGYNFNIFKYQPNDSNSLPNNFIFALQEDTGRNCLWIATFGGGLAKLDFVTGQFRRYVPGANDSNSIGDQYLYDLLLDRQGLLWIATRNHGLTRFDPDRNEFLHFRNDKDKPGSIHDNRVRTLFEDSKSQLWIGTNKGMMRYHPESNSFSDAIPKLYMPCTVQTIAEDYKGMLWFGTDGKGLFRYDPVSGNLTQYLKKKGQKTTIPDNNIRILYTDSEKQLWIGTEKGLVRKDLTFGQADGGFTSYFSDPSDQHSLSHNFIFSILVDRYDNMWVGTNGGGINKYPKSARRFQLYSNQSVTYANVNINQVLSVAEDSYGRIWVGTYGEGLTVLDRTNKRARVFKHDPANDNTLSDNSVFSVVPDSGNILWVGTYNGLNRISYNPSLNTGSVRFRRFLPDERKKDWLGHHKIRCIRKLKNGTLWIGTYGGGISVFEPGTEKFNTIRNIPGDQNSLSNDNIWSIHEDPFGEIWIGTYGGGLNRFSPSEKKWTVYKHQPYSSNTISNDVVLSLYSDSNDIWIGTRAGLNVLNRASGRFRSYTIHHGLPNDVVYSILPDPPDHIWISTNHGISKITVAGDSVTGFRNFDVHSGLQGNEFNVGAGYVNQGGELFFGGTNGLSSFFPDNVRVSTAGPQVSVTAFKKFDKTIMTAPFIDYVDEIELSYRENYFSFEFAALDFTDPVKNRYAYMLKGFDEGWIYCGNRRYASYTNLDGGTYLFKVKGTNHDGEWNEKNVSVKIIIHPPVWKTLWFRVIVLMAVTALFAYIVHWRFKSIQYQKRMLEEQVRQRTAEVTDKNTRLQSALDEIQVQKNSLNAINLQLTQALEELKQSQNQLIQSEKMAALGHLVGGIAHEINNPLSFIDGNLTYFNDYMNNAVRIINETELWLRTSENKSTDEIMRSIEELKNKYDYQFIVSDMVNLLNACRHGTQRIKKIVDDLRHFSSTDESRLLSSNIHHCIDQAIISINHLFNEKIEIIKEYGNLPYVMCYPGLLTHAIRHIILNAVQAIEVKGIIKVRTFVDARPPAAIPPSMNTGSKIGIEISDNGKGIPEKIKHRIFDPFFTTKTIGQGTGLGLTIAYNIIKRHNGIVTCSSEEQRGSVFQIIIPVYMQ